MDIFLPLSTPSDTSSPYLSAPPARAYTVSIGIQTLHSPLTQPARQPATQPATQPARQPDTHSGNHSARQ